jgi:hypothetical protein
MRIKRTRILRMELLSNLHVGVGRSGSTRRYFEMLGQAAIYRIVQS